MRTLSRYSLIGACLDGSHSALAATLRSRRKTRQNIRRGRSISSSASRPAAATTSSRGSSGRNCRKAWASPSSSKTSRAAARSSRPNMSPSRRPTATRCWSAPAAWRSIRPSTPNCPTTRSSDFVAVSELGSFPLILIVNAASPIKSVAELVAYAKANPDKTNYASSSASFQLVTELFKQKTGAPMQVIPYKSANEFGDGGGLGPGDHDHRGRRPGVGQVKSGTGARARGRGAQADGGLAGRSDA